MGHLRRAWWRVRRWARHPISNFSYWWRRGRYSERRTYAIIMSSGDRIKPPENFYVLQWATAGGHCSLTVQGRLFLETDLATPPGVYWDMPVPLMVTRGQEICAGGDIDACLQLAGLIDVPSRRELRARRRAERGEP